MIQRIVLLLLFFLVAYCVCVSIVTCPVDCNSTPDIQAEIDACLVAQATLCNSYVHTVPFQDWASILGITDPASVNETFPATFTWIPTNETVPRVDCTGLVPKDHLNNGTFLYICVQTTFCYIDPAAQVTVSLSGDCNISAISAPGVGAIIFIGPATIHGAGLPISQYVNTQIFFQDVSFDGGGTNDTLLADCVLNSNLTMINVNISGFVGPYVLKGESCVYDIAVDLQNVTMQDIPGTPIYFEGIFGFRLFNFYCARCAQTNGSECVHVLISDGSRMFLDMENGNCFRVADVLPQRCRYCLTGNDGFCGSRCNEGEIQVYDRRSTQLFANCPTVDLMFIDFFTMTPITLPGEFDPACRVWAKPVCNFITAVNGQNFSQVFAFGGGDIVWDFDAPLLCVPGGTISPVAPPFFLTAFDNNLGDPVPLVVLPPLPTPPAFVDPSFEEYGVIWITGELLDPIGVIPFPPYTLFPPSGVIVDDSAIPARTGNWWMRCDNQALRSVTQNVTAGAGDVGNVRTLEFFGRRLSGQQSHYGGVFVRLLIDGVEQDRIQEPTFSATLVTAATYYLFTLNWSPPDTALHSLTLEADFRGATKSITFAIDDVRWQAPWAGLPIVDPSFEPHSKTWVDVPTAQVVVRQSDAPCEARTGKFLLYCGQDGFDRKATQQVVFTQDGVYTVTFFAQRRNSLDNYVGLTIDIVDGGTTLLSTPINNVTFPNDDKYYALYGQGGGIVISGAPVMMDLGFRCDFSVPPAGTANLCIDDVAIVAIGTIGLTPNTLGFSSQKVSSAPFIVNQTCDCSNFTAATRNVTQFPCNYALNNQTLCVEELPECCITAQMQAPAVRPHVLAADTACEDLGDPSCVFLVDCNFLVGDVRDCREFTCPAGPATPLTSIPNGFDFILSSCNENAPINSFTDSLLYPSGVADGGGGVVLYTPQPLSGALYYADSPTAFFKVCGKADDPSCFIYTGCDQPIVFNQNTQTYSITNCNLVDCTSPSGLIPSTQAQLAACAFNSGPFTLTSVGGGWTFRTDGSAAFFTETQLFLYLNELADAGGDSSFVPVFQLPLFASLVACGPPSYFSDCPCVPANDTHTVPPNSVNNDPSVLDNFYTCTSGVPSCRCNDVAIQASNPPPANSITYHIVVAPDTLGLFRFLNMRAQQHMWALEPDQVTYELVVRNTIAKPQFYDDRAICRELLRNDNEFVRGSPGAGGGDCVQGNPGGPYSVVCNTFTSPPYKPCLMWYGQFAQVTSEADFQCIVDARATEDLVGFGTTVFNTISGALAGCSKDIVGVRANTVSGYYTENLQIEKSNKNIFLVSLESAIVVGRHTIGTSADNVTIIGMHFVHPADNQQPLFDVAKQNQDSNLNKFTLLNDILDGSGCRKCGIVASSRINEMVVNYTQLNDWQFFTVKLDDVLRYTMAHCVFNGTEGESLLIKYKLGFVMDTIDFVGCRGGAELNGAAITSFTAKQDSACDESDADHRCLFRHPVQHVTTTADVERFSDGCYFFSRGSLHPEVIYDCVCRLAQNGIIFLKTLNIDAAVLVNPLMLANPLNRPHLFWLPDKPQGADWVLRGTEGSVSNEGDTFFFFDDTVKTNYDTSPFLLPLNEIHCRSNINFDERFAFGSGVNVPRMGVELFHNASYMVEFCEDRRTVMPILPASIIIDLKAFIGNVSSFNGSTITRDVLSVYRDAQLQGDDVGACCNKQNFPPTLEGIGNRLLTIRLNMTDLRFTMPPNPDPLDMWSSGPGQYDPNQITAQTVFEQAIPNEILLVRVIADGRNVLPARPMWAFKFIVGVQQKPEFFKADTNKPPPPTTIYVLVNDSIIRNFPSFNSETSPDGFNFIPGQYPYASGMQVLYFNRLSADSVLHMFNFTVADVDMTGLDVRFANNYTIENCTFLNCSGRALGNEACVNLYGNDVSGLIRGSKNFNATDFFLKTPANLFWQFNNGFHSNNVLFPHDDRFAEPGWVAHFQIMGFPNTTDYCIFNGSTFGLPIGVRQDETLNLTLLHCKRFTSPPPTTWPDLARYLRAQCIMGSLAGNHGTEHDLAFGHKSTDLFGETIFCDSPDNFTCCPLINPARCVVILPSSPSGMMLLTPSNPWFGQFVFGSLNDAIVNCNASERFITVIGSADPFKTGDTTIKTYTEVISATVPLVALSGTAGPLTIEATTGVIWKSVGNHLVTQCVHTTVREFVFQHDGTPASAIWDQLAADDSCGLELFHNFWNVTTDGWAIRAFAGDFFRVISNTVRGHLITRRAIEVRGNGTCTDVGIAVNKNDVSDVLGVGIDMLDLNCFTVEDNKLTDVGGQDATSFIPYSLHINPCTAPGPLNQRCIKIGHNTVHGVQVVNALVGLTAACWLDPVPILTKHISITENECKGLQIGMRFNNMPDTSPSGDPKQQLRALCIQDKNAPSKGLKVPPLNKRFDLVHGDPVNDASLVSDPNSPANKGRWCTDCCSRVNAWLIWAILMALGLFLLICIGCCLVTGCCTPSKYMFPILKIFPRYTASNEPPNQFALATPFDNDPYVSAVPAGPISSEYGNLRQRKITSHTEAYTL